MKAAAHAGRARRARVPRDSYRATARAAGFRSRLRGSALLVDLAVLAIATYFVVQTGPVLGSALNLGIRDIGDSIGGALAAQQGSGRIDLPTGVGSVGTEPVVSGLPDFTREPQIQLSGRVPAFAVAEGRTVEIALNGTPIATVPLDEGGAFGAPLSLKDGPNAITVTLLSDTDVIARSSYTIVLDRQPPTLTLTRPTNGETLDGPTVVVEGKSEPGVTIIVNSRTVVPAQDGSFSESLTPSAGPLAITVISRDRAGNETTARTSVVVRNPITVAPATVSVTLDRTRVRPGEIVFAQIIVIENGRPRPNTLVTLSVGVITIGSAVTDAFGNARIGFAAPPNEGEAAVVVLGAGTAGRATLTIAR